MVKLILTAFALVLTSAQQTFAQAPQNISFETASVRPSKSDSINRGIRAAGEQFTATNVWVEDLIRVAYQLRINDERLIGLPGWAQTATYTVVAKAPGGVKLTLPNLVPDGGPPSTLALMVRGLLADRFRLKIHTEARPMPAYALVMAQRDRKPGRNLVECSTLPDPSKCGIRSPGFRLVGDGISMGRLSNMLSMMVQRDVVDRTELDGAYDITLDYTPDQSLAPPFGAPVPGAPDGPSLFTALEEQLGLKLEPTKTAVEFFVVDSVAQPEPD
jgi:bla regulator protein BlaR1